MNVWIVIVGMGYVGLVSGICFVEFGYDVVCIDNNCGKIDVLNEGCMLIYELGFDVVVVCNVECGMLCFSNDFVVSVCDCDVVFIVVGMLMLFGIDYVDL